MSIQKTLIATIAGFVGLFGLGLVIYVLIFPDLQFTTAAGEGVTRNYFPGIIVFEILYALLLTIIFERWAGIKTFNTGLKTGAVIGLILGLISALWAYSTTTLYTANIIWWFALTFVVRFGVAGGLIGLVLGREKD